MQPELRRDTYRLTFEDPNRGATRCLKSKQHSAATFRPMLRSPHPTGILRLRRARIVRSRDGHALKTQGPPFDARTVGKAAEATGLAVAAERDAGFTLIELMIVVAILAIIASMAIPNLLSARVNANESAAIAK